MAARKKIASRRTKETKRERLQRIEIEKLKAQLARAKKASRGKADSSLRRQREPHKKASSKTAKKKRKTKPRLENVDKRGILRARSYEQVAERLDLKNLEARREEARLPKLPKSKIRGGTTTLAFSDKGKGKWKNGGQTVFDFPSTSDAQVARASRLLKRLKPRLTAWQVSRSWVISYTGGGGVKRRRAEIGFSPWKTKRETSPGSIKAALGNSASHAAKGAGLDLAYEGKVPKNIKSDPNDRSFRLYVWWKAGARKYFIDTEGE